MLINETYIGNLTQGRRKKINYKLKNEVRTPKEEWIIVENTHEPIVDRKTFELVQKRFEGRRKPDKQGEVDKFAGYLFCGECGHRLYLHRGKTVKTENNAFQCGGFQRRVAECTAHYIREQVIEQIVLESLKRMTALARENPDKFYEMATQNGKAEAQKFYAIAEKQQHQIEGRIKELDRIIRVLYEDRVVGRITPERYDEMANSYEQEQTELKQELQSINDCISEMDMTETCIRDFIEKAKQYIEMPKLTPELLRIFIRKIVVHEKAEKYSRTCGNAVVIYYTFQIPKSELLRRMIGEDIFMEKSA